MLLLLATGQGAGAALPAPGAGTALPAPDADAGGGTADGTRTGPPSGTDASCPAVDPAAAGAANVGAPTRVRAIPGAASVTVVWCPPDTGAASVTRYTVTASTTGGQVTANQPNDWAIVTGLADGTPVRFTVIATTTGGTTGPAATSPAVTPQPIHPPGNVERGQSRTVSYDQNSLSIGGQRVFITSGEYHPWRTPSPSLWLDDLQKMRADGYNTVTVYFDWDYHSPAPGVYDFGGIRDMNEFLNVAQRVGLYVIVRPGPYINAETDGGGIPSWVLTGGGSMRTESEPYLSAARQWFSQIDAIIAPHQITSGGDVIAYQIENEYTGRAAADLRYMADLEAQARGDGIGVPFTFNQCCGGPFYSSGTGAVNISGPDNYPLGFNCANPNGFGQPYGYPTQPGEPLYLPEFQGGSFDGWGGAGYDNCYRLTGPSFENVYYKNNVAQGATMQNNYMGVGGTNWGWLPTNFIYTSYDYGAAIRETGEIGTPDDPNSIAGSKYGENKLINTFETSVPPLTTTVPVNPPRADTPAVSLLARADTGTGTQVIYVRQANATSTATVHTHLAVDLQPRSGYTYDDAAAALQYTGAWTHAGASSGYTNGDYASTESWSTATGASVSVPFTGTAVEWIGPKNTNGGIADVSIDGVSAGTVDTYAASGKQFQQVLFARSGLAAGSHTLSITVTGTKNPASTSDTVVVDAIDVPTAAQAADFYPAVPQQPGTSLTLVGRDARLLLTGFDFAGQHLAYSTSELATQASVGGRATALLYGPAGTDGETVLRYAAQPAVTVLAGSVQSTWDASRGDLRLNYVHNGLAEVLISGGGRPPLLLLLAEKNVAETFWPVSTPAAGGAAGTGGTGSAAGTGGTGGAGSALVQGGYLVRTATARGGVLDLTGDTSKSDTLTVWAPAGVHAVRWNGRPVAVTRQADGSLRGSVPGPAPVSLPALTGWRFSTENPETAPGFDDRAWTLADHPSSTHGAPASGPVLYASDYGYQHGFVWYRGHFTATGTETAITLKADGFSPTGEFAVWLNGAYLGAHSAAGPQQATVGIPAGALKPGGDNVIAVLVESTGNPEGPSTEPFGLYGAALAGSSASITWRLQGSIGGTTLQDPVRGPLSASGLYGTNHGWDLPGYPVDDWSRVSLPDSWASRGLPAGIGWYRTTFELGLPQRQYVPLALQIGSAATGTGTARYRAFIYLNGYLLGQYANNIGPQHQFYLPAGILNQHGRNTLAIAVWGLDAAGGGLDQVSLVAMGNQAGGVPVRPVAAPGYDPRVYGPPAAPVPTLGVVPSKTLASGTFTVAATLANPTPRPLSGAAVSLRVPSGWTVSPTGPAPLGRVTPGGSATATFSVTVPATGLSPGDATLLATAGYDGGTQLLGATQLAVPQPSLAATFNNTGITDNANTNPVPDFAGFDGIGTTFSLQGLARAGLTPGAAVTADGLHFTWPDVPVAQPGNTMAQGQTIAVHGSGARLGFLASSNNSAESGTGTVYYTDGTTQAYTLSIGNFWYPSGQSGNPANVQVAAVDYANYPSGSSGHEVYVFEQSVPLQAGKTVEAVTLPALGDVAGYNAAMHIFDIAVG